MRGRSFCGSQTRVFLCWVRGKGRNGPQPAEKAAPDEVAGVEGVGVPSYRGAAEASVQLVAMTNARKVRATVVMRLLFRTVPRG